MKRLQLIAGLAFVTMLTALGQRPPMPGQESKAYKDTRGRIVTIFDDYYSTHKQVTYLGTQYLTFPTWQKGIIQVDKLGKEISCELAYDLIMNKILCRFDDKAKEVNLTPYSFSISGLRFVRQLNSVLGLDYQLYATTVHDGPTSLLKSFSNRLVSPTAINGYVQAGEFNGMYQTTVNYYIRKGEAQPERIDMSRKSVVDVLYEQSEKIMPTLQADKLTEGDVARALVYYDSLMAVASVNKPALSFDPVFNQFLHSKLAYPNQAWVNYRYGRVYVGFDVDVSGIIRNIKLLSPETSGYGFDTEVKQALKKVGKLNPEFAGQYALPVAFSLTNTKEKGGPHMPANTLSGDQLAGRTVLNELVVPVIISKPVNVTQEIWGNNK